MARPIFVVGLIGDPGTFRRLSSLVLQGVAFSVIMTAAYNGTIGSIAHLSIPV